MKYLENLDNILKKDTESLTMKRDELIEFYKTQLTDYNQNKKKLEALVLGDYSKSDNLTIQRMVGDNIFLKKFLFVLISKQDLKTLEELYNSANQRDEDTSDLEDRINKNARLVTEQEREFNEFIKKADDNLKKNILPI